MELLGKSLEELRAFCKEAGEPGYRGGQIYRALYAEGTFAIAEMTTLPLELREKLGQQASITLPKVRQRYVSSDGSVRYLFGLGDGGQEQVGAAKKNNSVGNRQRPASVEAVFMPSEGRQTICVSSQAGCAVDCHFCLTAQLGLIRNLSAGEILGQVLVPLKDMQAQGLAPRTNVVLMGQGEPLLNFENVMAAMRILLDQKGVSLSPKYVSISTSGIVPGIEKLAKEEIRPKLAISLNASNDEQRDALMPINRKYPLKDLLEACRAFPLRKWEYLMFEYVMLGGVNDTEADARRVARLIAPMKRAKVNLIPWNPGELPFQESNAQTIETFQRILMDRGVPTYVRYSRGRDVMAACGQLALNEVQNQPLTILG
jgi:23S rRNA (adenine2503-C2)-methyltransferase